MPDFGDLNPDLIDAVKGFEGYSPKPQWDYQQYSSGWGTKARPGEAVDRATHEQRLRDELEKAATFVDTKVPGLPQGVRDAMISLTFNAGGNWVNAGLGQKLREGDYTTAQQLFTQYNKAGGKPLQGLTDRRNTEAAWFNNEDGTASGSPAGNPVQANDLGIIGQQSYGRTRMDQQQPPGLLQSLFGGGQQDQQGGGLFGGAGGLIGAIDPQKMAYLGMIAKGLDPYSSIDPNSMLKNAQADQIARMRLAQTQQEHNLDRQIRQGQLGLNTRAQDRQDAEFQYKQQQLDEARKAGTEIYGAAGQPDTGGLTRENIFKYMQQYPNMDKSTRDFLESRLNALENQGKISRDIQERQGQGQQQGLEGPALQEYTLTGKVTPQDKPIPAEVSGRLALADSYLKKAPQIGEAIDQGKLTGPYDVTMGKLGIGEQGQIAGDMKSGVDALRRMLTGAGMPQSEADEYVKRYEPGYQDTASTLKYKHNRLVEELSGMRDNIMRGRGSAPSPSSQVGRKPDASADPLGIR